MLGVDAELAFVLDDLLGSFEEDIGGEIGQRAPLDCGGGFDRLLLRCCYAELHACVLEG